MICNTSKLKGIMVEQGITQDEMAKRMSIDRSTFNRKLKCGVAFTIGEAHSIVTILNLSKDEAADIFFGNTVA